MAINKLKGILEAVQARGVPLFIGDFAKRPKTAGIRTARWLLITKAKGGGGKHAVRPGFLGE